LLVRLRPTGIRLAERRRVGESRSRSVAVPVVVDRPVVVTFNATLLQRLGMSQGELDEMARGGSGALEGREAALLQLVRQALSEPATVSAEHVEPLRRLGWMDGDILDAVMHGAALMGSSLVHRAFAR
jgi:alkylhydroperoxidase family enzyme